MQKFRNALRCFPARQLQQKIHLRATLQLFSAGKNINKEETTFLGHGNTSAEFLKVSEKSLNFAGDDWEQRVDPCRACSYSQL